MNSKIAGRANKAARFTGVLDAFTKMEKNVQSHPTALIRDVCLGTAANGRISMAVLVPLFRHVVVVMTF